MTEESPTVSSGRVKSPGWAGPDLALLSILLSNKHR